MKKIAVLLLLVLSLVGCGKKENGTLTIKNTSSYSVVCKVGQNYQITGYLIEPTATKTITWEYYLNFWIESPENLVTYERVGNIIIIKDISHIYNYRVTNGVAALAINDNHQYILLSNDRKYTKSINIPLGTSTLNSTRPMDVKNIIIDTSSIFSIEKMEYKTFEKVGDSYFFNENNNGKLISTKLNITIINDNIIISK